MKTIRNITFLTALFTIFVVGALWTAGFTPNVSAANNRAVLADTTLATDDFTYADGALVPNGDWVNNSGTAGTLEVVSGEAQVTQNSGSEDAELVFADDLMTGVLTATFDIRIEDTGGSGMTGSDFEYFAHFSDDTNFNFRSRLDVVTPNGGGDYTLGLATSSSTAETQLPVDFSFSDTVSVTLVFNLDTGLSSVTAGGQTTTTTTVALGETIDTFNLRQSNSSSDETIFVDNLVITWSEELLYTLQILHASDLEGGVDAIDNAPNFATIVDEFEQDTGSFDGSVLLSAGDNYIPGPFFSAAGDRTVFRDGGVFNDTYNTFFGVATYDSLREGNGRVDISIMNVMGFDASAVGNHEFDASPSTIADIIVPDFRDPAGPESDRWVGAQFPYLSANLDFTGDDDLGEVYTDTLLLSTSFASGPDESTNGTDSPKLAPATIISRSGEYVGVVGATTQLVESISSTGDVNETTGGANDMAALAAVLNPIIAELQLGLDGVADTDDDVNKIILVSHLQQIALEEALILLLNGVDVVIAGGSDTILADGDDVLRPGDAAEDVYPVVTTNADSDPAVIVSTDGEYSYVGRLVVSFDSDGILDTSSIEESVSGIYPTTEDGLLSVTGEVSSTVAISNSVPGTEVQTLVDAVSGVVVAKDSNVLGYAGVFIEGRREAVRTEETNMGNLTADANLWTAQDYDGTVAVSIKNGGGIRAEIGTIDADTGDLLPTEANAVSGKFEGQISQLDIENTLRFNNGLTLMDLTYQELEYILEHGVAATEDGATPGQFPQVAGLRFSFDPTGDAIVFDDDGNVTTDGTRVQSIALVDELGNVSTVIMEDGAFVANPDDMVRVVTLDFLWGLFSDADSAFGGDGYPFKGYGENVIQLKDALGVVRAADFADPGSEQDALAEYLVANFATVPYYTSDTASEQDMRIQNLSVRNDAVTADVQTEELNITNLGSFGLDGAEISAFDADSDRLFVTYGDGLQVVDMSNPVKPTLLMTITHSSNGADSDDTTSVAVGTGGTAGMIAAGVPASTVTDNGSVYFYQTDGTFLGSVEVGPLPDMVTFSPDGAYLLVANEGESGDPEENAPGFDPNPEGSVSIIMMNTTTVASSVVSTYAFDHTSITTATLQAKGIRVHEEAPSAAADLEPEYITIEGTTAYIALQENNAMAVIDDITNFSGFTIDDLFSLGTKDHTLPFNMLDPSNEDGPDDEGLINLQNAPLHGLYMPDAIASFEVGGVDYIVTANEGDGRGDADQDFGGDEARIKDYGDSGFPELDPYAFLITEVYTDVVEDAVFGRIKTSSIDGDTDGDDDIDEIHSFGGRSFSIYDEDGNQVFDSGDLFARVTAAETPDYFNANDGDTDEFDQRSDDKGMEPEGVTLGEIAGELYAFIGLERAGGGVMIFNISDPANVQFVDYIRVDGDISPEGLTFISASDSPNGRPMLVVAHEESNNIRIFSLADTVEIYLPIVFR